MTTQCTNCTACTCGGDGSQRQGLPHPNIAQERGLRGVLLCSLVLPSSQPVTLKQVIRAPCAQCCLLVRNKTCAKLHALALPTLLRSARLHAQLYRLDLYKKHAKLHAVAASWEMVMTVMTVIRALCAQCCLLVRNKRCAKLHALAASWEMVMMVISLAAT